MTRVLGAGVERCDKAGCITPRAGVVVVHNAYLIHQRGKRCEVGARQHLGRISNRNREPQSWAQSIHLPAELRHEGQEVGSLVLLRRLPINIKSVKDPWLIDSGRKMSAQESINTRGDESAPVFRLGALRAAGGGALHRNQTLV